MADPPARLKLLLRERHWQKYATFCREYDKAARSVDPELIGPPSRAQLHRWLSGDLKGLPYPDHCQVLETMFPGWLVQQLLEPCAAADLAVESEIANQSDVQRLLRDVAAGLDAPDAERPAWGPAARSSNGSGRTNTATAGPSVRTLETSVDLAGVDTATQEIGRKLIMLARVWRLSREEAGQLARLAGNVVELDQRINIDVGADGWSTVTYHHDLFNMSDRPVTRFGRELWFEHTDGPLVIEPTAGTERQLAIQRVHDTPNLAKFACRISPAIQPGQTAAIAYTCRGGQFVSDHYWRQALPRYTRHLTINLRHRDRRRLLGCSATEEHPDGSENSADDGLIWDYDGSDTIITLTRDYLRPTQVVTLRWDVTRDPA